MQYLRGANPSPIKRKTISQSLIVTIDRHDQPASLSLHDEPPPYTFHPEPRPPFYHDRTYPPHEPPCLKKGPTHALSLSLSLKTTPFPGLHPKPNQSAVSLHSLSSSETNQNQLKKAQP
ncbi:hypothetical protein RJT34_02073 [Clitoria ternatea]|uniref:Uncharacterized protein n=1 Tax=Clitoria ternatea TaxID=43366 RepID=A0AAN9KI95_CLITE